MISERLLSKFNVINITFPDETNILRIYGTMLGQHLAEFNEIVKITGREITETTIDLYNNVSMKMLPTPTKIHYLFNLRDISKIFQGLLRAHKDFHDNRTALLRLWIHECFRVFYDRLIDDRYVYQRTGCILKKKHCSTETENGLLLTWVSSWVNTSKQPSTVFAPKARFPFLRISSTPTESTKICKTCQSCANI